MTTTPITTPITGPITGPIAGLPRVALPGTPAFEAATTPWNVAVAQHPAAVVLAESADDVVAAVRYAGDHGLRVSVQATGHGASADLADTILVATAAVTDLELNVSPDLQTAWVRVGAGVTWKQVLEATAEFGFAGPAGSAPGVGVVGYVTGGGVGPLVRTLGLASDRVRAFEVVTGDGVMRRATPSEHPDLYWGLRGGKGMLGVVTAVELDLVKLPEIYAGAVYFDGDDAPAVLHAWRSWHASLPTTATTSVALLRLPDLPGVPPPLAGRLTVAVRFAHTGGALSGEALVAPMRAAATPIIDTVAVMPYAALGAVHADPVDPMPSHEEHTLLSEVTDETVDRLLALAGPGVESPQFMVEVRHLGGAMSTGAPSAFGARDAAFALLAVGLGVPPVVEAVVAHAQALLTAVEAWDTRRRLPNFGARFDHPWLEATYDAPTRAHLSRIAAEYDPRGTLDQGRLLRS